MPNYQSITIIGHLGRDPEIRTTPSGKTVAGFSVAVSETYKDSKTTEWFNIVVWEKLAEICQRFLHKGDPVMIVGKLRTREYDAKDGTRKKAVEVIASNMVLMSSKRQAEAAPESPAAEPIGDSDIPF
jgi:single-strand DNA-binding protein